jgi:hypothetical protein
MIVLDNGDSQPDRNRSCLTGFSSAQEIVLLPATFLSIRPADG